KFLKYVTQRSGLLIPRGMDEEGNDLFSFVHLTFQEYFAALHLRSLAWDFSQVVEHCSAHLTHRYWHETILVLFEMLAEMRGSGDRLVKLLAEQAKEPEQQQAAAEIFSALLLDSESGLSPAAQEQAAFFALDVICEQSNGIVIRNLKALPQTNLKGWIAKPMLQQLREGNLFQLGSDFLLIGDDFFSDWPQVVKEIVTVRGNDSWPSEQVACATLIASRAKEIVEWAGSRMPLHFWLAPIRRFWGMCTATIEGREIMLSNLSLAELNFSLLINAQAFSIKHNLLAQAALSMAINGSQFLRSSVKARQFGLPLARQIDQSLARYFSQSLSQYLNTFLHRSLSQYVERSSDWYLTRYFDRALAINTGHYVDIYLGQLISTYQLIVNPKTTISSTDIKDIVTLSATAEWLSFQPDQESERLATIEALRKFLPATKDNDDWTRLLAINNLITLSAGTPELVAERNRLCDKAMTTPDEFTFPAELREATQDKEWFNLPEIIAIIFLHEPGDPFLKPEWFDPKNEESKFFLSPPREFFALAAEVLDPEGKTELAKWRNGKFQNKESSTA
ncbi:MAG TPA: hypothetical protein PKD31_03050, partial [Blastocatellia bacterium]|nr:hypothetical protein [Blastocatellia bacterium]